MVNKSELIKTAVKKNITLILIGSILLILLFITGIYYIQLKPDHSHPAPKAEMGLFDFSGVDFDHQKYVRLEGDVEFYWQELLTPEDLKKSDDSRTPYYMELPGAWNGHSIDGEKLGAKGYGTYRFKIRVDSLGMYAFKIKEFESAFKIWVNGKDMGGAGKVGTSRKDMAPSWKRQEFDICAMDNTIEVVLQVSNFHHRLGGASESILFGLSASIRSIKQMRVGIETFLLGVLIILILYHLTLSHYRRVDLSALFFSLLCLFILLRLSTTGEKLLLELLPFIPWSFAIRIEYISMPLIGVALSGFFRHMLPDNISTRFVMLIHSIATVLCVVILFFPASIFTYTTYAISGAALFLVVSLFIFLLQALLQKKENSLGLFLGFAMLSAVMINDILFYLHVINTAFMLPFGLIILLLTQAFIISRNSSLAFVQVEQLSEKLEKHAEELEETVEKRTQELREQAETLDQTNKKLLELDTFKKEMTRMMVHDLKNPLANMIGLMQLPEQTQDIKDLVSYSGNEMQNLIQNILDVTKFQETELKLYPGKALLYELADAAYQQNKYNLELNSTRFENHISKDLIIEADKELIVRTFVNIISNASKHMEHNGLINISSEILVEDHKKFYKINIFNNGELIPEDKLEAIFDVYHQIYSQHDGFKYSTGIGLTFCKMAIEAHGGKIGAISEEGKGVTFWFTLPVNSY